MQQLNSRKHEPVVYWLTQELETVNDYAKLNFQSAIKWFVFHATINYLALGWYIVRLVDSSASNGAVVFLATFMTVQNAITVFTCGEVRRAFNEAELRLQKITEHINGCLLPEHPLYRFQHGHPSKTYRNIATLMLAVVLTMVVAWLAALAILFLGVEK